MNLQIFVILTNFVKIYILNACIKNKPCIRIINVFKYLRLKLMKSLK